MDDLVEKHWPHVAALHRMLEAIEAKSIAVGVSPDGHVDAVIDGINRRARGGPVLNPEAIG